MYTPGGSTWTNDSALPRLKRPSELPNAYGIIAPVSTTVLPACGGSASASARAVSTIVSVPCVTRIRVSAAFRQWSTMSARSSAVMSRLSIIISVRMSTSTRLRPSLSISARCVSLKASVPVSSLYCLSKVPPVTKIRITIDPPRNHENTKSGLYCACFVVSRFVADSRLFVGRQASGNIGCRGQVERVEQQRKRGVRLRAVLRTEPEEHHVSRIHVDRHDGGPAGHQFLALQPPGGEHAGVRIPCDDARFLRRKSFDQREERAVDVEPVCVRRDAVAERVGRINFEPQDRAGSEVLVPRQSFLQIPHRNRQPLDRQVARIAHRNERSTVRDELLETVDAGLADAAAILRPDRVS